MWDIQIICLIVVAVALSIWVIGKARSLDIGVGLPDLPPELKAGVAGLLLLAVLAVHQGADQVASGRVPVSLATGGWLVSMMAILLVTIGRKP